MSIFLITKEDVYKIHARPAARPEFHGESYTVEVFKTPDQMLTKKLISFTDTLLGSRNIPEVTKLNLAMRVGGRLFAQGSTRDGANVTSDNFEAIQGREADDKAIESELMFLITKFFETQPVDRMAMKTNDLFISTDFRIEDIKRRLQYLANRDLIEWFSTDTLKITAKGFEEGGFLGGTARTREIIENKYFQLVPLPKGVKEPFAFVLMPFKDEEIDQKVYREVVKPTVEKELGILCLRSDEVTDPGVINNQIFTLIKKAKIIIAETTSKNPNVFYEIGMAHAFDKDVFLFAERKSGPLPFDITTHRAVFYDDLGDLRQKIVDNLKHHIS